MDEEKKVEFSIQCPHCFKWTLFSASPDEVFTNLNELQSFLQTVSDSSIDKYIFRCSSESWECPANFEAVIFKPENGEVLRREDISVPNSWADVHTFRLWSKDHLTRVLGNYQGVLFCTRPVSRLPSVELEHLLNFDLLSKAIHGICAQVDIPVTIYAAKVLGKDKFNPSSKSPNITDACEGGVCWLPVETYDKDRQNPLLPPMYNPYCGAKRKIFFEHMRTVFIEEFKPEKCRFRNKCRMKPACLRKDWNLCPAFVSKRLEYDNCYQSDLQGVGAIRKRWNENKFKSIFTYDCETGFHEKAVPIIVHDHLAGVAFCGQVFDEDVIKKLKPSHELKFFDEYKSIADRNQKNDAIERYGTGLRKLKKAKTELSNAGNEERFEITTDQLEVIAERLQENVEEIQNLADTRYLHLRTSTESFFRKEMRQQIRKKIAEGKTIWHQYIPNILDRMREFWGFKAGAILLYHLPHNDKSKVMSPQSWFSPKEGGIVNYPNEQPSADLLKQVIGSFQSFHYTYDPAEKEKRPPHPWLQLLENYSFEVNGAEIKLTDDRKKLIIIVPVFRRLYVFEFIERDEENISPLRSNSDLSSISSLCEEVVSETCIEVAHELYKFAKLTEPPVRIETKEEQKKKQTVEKHIQQQRTQTTYDPEVLNEK